MIRPFNPEQKQETQKKVAFITEEGSPDHKFAVCFLIEKGEEAIIYSPGDNSYEVKHNVGKRVTLTALYPADKGMRKWIAKAAPYQLLPEDFQKDITRPVQHLQQSLEHKKIELQRSEPEPETEPENEDFKHSPKLPRLSIQPEQYDYVSKVALAKGYRGRLAMRDAIKDILSYCKDSELFLND
jgi:hypothetical protein